MLEIMESLHTICVCVCVCVCVCIYVYYSDLKYGATFD